MKLSRIGRKRLSQCISDITLSDQQVYFQLNIIMLRRNLPLNDCVASVDYKIDLSKDAHHSISTEDSFSPRDQQPMTFHKSSMKQNKEKSQLCKKFIEQGFCPYQKKCKFAHGSHELKKNCEVNSKYKTKSCVAFEIDGCCLYGNRCNFIHTLSQTSQHTATLDPEFIQLRKPFQTQSRLLQLVAKKQ